MRYDGYNGDVEADERVVTIIREGMVARAAFGKVPPRVIPLTAIAGVRLQPATRLKNGFMQILLAGQEAPELSVKTAASNADTVLFTHKHDEAFTTLASWLDQVARHNQSSGALAQDQTLLASTGQQGRFDRIAASAAAKAEESRAKVSEVRPAAQPAQAASADDGFIDWAKFQHLLYDGQSISLNYDDEQPEQLDLALQEVKLAKKELATARRDITQAISEIRADHRDKQANRMPSVRGGGRVGQVMRAGQAISKANDRARTQNSVAPLEEEKFRLDRMVTALDQIGLLLQQEGASATRRAPARAAGPVDVADQLTKLADLLDRGVLTEEEFAVQKAKLLGGA